MSENEYDRPILVTIIAVIYALMAIFLIVIGVVGVAGVVIDPDLEIYAYGGGVLIVLGLITAVISAGFFRGWSIMWYLGVIFTVIELIASVITLVLGVIPVVITLIISILILYYLFRPKVKLFFLKRE